MKRLLTMSAILIMAVLSFAEESGSDWNLYGSSRLGGAYWNRGHWYAYKTDSLGVQDSNNIQFDTLPIRRFMYDMQFNSRFGASIQKEKIGFRFEAGWGYALRDMKVKIVGNTANVSQRVTNALTLRRLYGEWYINDNFTILMGHEWNIANFFNSNQIFDGEMGLGYSGSLYTGRRPQLKVTYQDNIEPINWKIQVAAVRADTFIIPTGTEYEEAEEIIPKFEGSAYFGLSTEIFDISLQLIGGFARYRQLNHRIIPDAKIVKIKSECYAVELKSRIWKFHYSTEYSRGINLAAYGAYMGDPEGYRGDTDMKIFFPYWGFRDSMAQVEQRYSMCPALIRQFCHTLNFAPAPLFAAEIGVGAVFCFPTAYDLKEQAKAALNAFTRVAGYVNLQWAFVDDHVKVVFPEFSVSDLGGGLGGQTITGSGGVWFAVGCKLQIDM